MRVSGAGTLLNIIPGLSGLPLLAPPTKEDRQARAPLQLRLTHPAEEPRPVATKQASPSPARSVAQVTDNMEVLVGFLVSRLGRSAASFNLAEISGAVSRVTPGAIAEATDALMGLLTEVGPEFASRLTGRLGKGFSRGP